MYKGTPIFPGNTAQDTIWGHGGSWNAVTSMDFTAYYTMLPSQFAEIAVQIEADRLQNMQFDPGLVDVERLIIAEERSVAESRPNTVLHEALLETAYREFPYRHLAIGSREDIAAVTAEKLRTHFLANYRPENAAIVLVGDVDHEPAVEMVERHFGLCRRTSPVGSTCAHEPQQSEQRRVCLRRPVSAPYLASGWKIPGVAHPDCAALDVLAVILGGAPSFLRGGAKVGRYSRLYQRMVRGALTADVTVATTETKHPGLFVTSFSGVPRVQLEDIECALQEEVSRVRGERVTRVEVDRAIRQLRTQFAYAQENLRAQAIGLARSLSACGNPSLWADWVSRIGDVTPEDVSRVAQTYLVSERQTVAVLVPASNGAPVTVSRVPRDSREADLSRTPLFQRSDIAERPPALPAQSKGLSLLDSDRIVAYVLPNGLRLFVYPVESFRSVAIRVAVEAGVSWDPPGKAGLALITAKLLTAGTETRSAGDIASIADSLGFDLSVDAGNEIAHGHVYCLPEDLQTGIRLLLEIITRPAFPQGELSRLKSGLYASIKRDMLDSGSCAERRLHELLYPENHPFRTSPKGTLETLDAIGLSDVIDFYGARFRPKGAVAVVVGNVVPSLVLDVFSGLVAAWNGTSAEGELFPAPSGTARRDHVEIAGAKRVDIAMGWATVDRTAVDSIALELLAVVLGKEGLPYGGRLWRNFRERLGLSYYQHCSFTPCRGQTPWLVRAGINPLKADLAVDLLMDEVGRLRDETVTPYELDYARRSLEGFTALSLQEVRTIAFLIEQMARQGFGFDYLQRRMDRMDDLTPEELRDTARRHFLPDVISIVTAGPKLGI